MDKCVVFVAKESLLGATTQPKAKGPEKDAMSSLKQDVSETCMTTSSDVQKYVVTNVASESSSGSCSSYGSSGDETWIATEGCCNDTKSKVGVIVFI